MANDLLERPDQKDDEELNPGQKHADDLFDFLENPDNVADSSQEDANIDRQKLRDSEVAGSLGSGVATPRRKAASKDELQDAEEPDSLYNPDVGGRRGLRGFFFSTKRRKQFAISGTIATIITGGGIIATVITTGPLQLIHLAETLEHPFSKVEGDSTDRSTSMIEFARALRTGDYRYTRMGVVGARTATKVLADLDAAGMSFEGKNLLLRPTSVALDRAKLQKTFPHAENMSNEEFREFMAGTLSTDGLQISPDDLRPAEISSGGKVTKWRLNTRKFDLGQIYKLSKQGQIGLLGRGKISAGLKARQVGKFFGLGSKLFHPFSYIVQNAIQKGLGRLSPGESEEDESKKAVQADEDGKTAGTKVKAGIEGEKVTEAVNKQQKGDRYKKFASAGLAIMVEAACVIRQVGPEIPTLDYYAVQAPAEIHAADALARASQIENGTGGLTADQVNGFASSLIDKNGNPVFSAAAMQALQGNSPAIGSDNKYVNDLPSEDRQAFSQHTTADELTSVADAFLTALVTSGTVGVSSAIPHATGFIIDHVICDPYGQIIGVTLVGLISLVTDFFDDGGTTAAELAAASATRVAEAGAGAADQAFLQKYVLGPIGGMVLGWFINNHTAGKLAADAFSGPLGGNLLAFGARGLANVAAIGAGGIAITGSATSTIVSPQDKVAQAQFEHESMFARIFDARDYRSLTGRLADDVSPSLFTNASSTLNGLLNTGGSLLKGFGALIPRASAADSTSWSGDFPWGFPQYGIPDSMLNEDDLANPYQNSTNVGSYFENNCVKRDDNGNVIARGPEYGACDGSTGYRQRIKACFENDLTYDSSQDVWDVIPIAGTQSDPVEVDPYDAPYTDKGMDCNKISNQDWKRIVMFVHDTHDMKDMACFNGDDQSCTDEGISTGNGADDSGSDTTTTAGSDIDMANLDKDSTSVACADGTKDIGNYTGYTSGKPVQIKLCAIPNLPSSGEESNGGYGVTGGAGNAVVNSRVSGAVLSMVKAAAADGVKLSAKSSYRSMAHQQKLCADNADCSAGNPATVAIPGTSNHQMGVAIDFSVDMCDKTINGQCSDPGNPIWDWLNKYADNFGYHSKVVTEAWHWSPSGN
ncbi:MAG TPA: D-alanyl-D-alanine carboxypeptidase family protein [Candidatus Saccharimonadales bacterium]|nr:D-alanyl-D-alanine carboxypeptidase family protein [Candidatus Saccharimonadales bacterium]